MKKELHLGKDRGSNKLDWLDSWYSFSFARYYNPNRLGFGELVVLNDDIISPGKGFGAHPHENMEIITVVTEGVLEHRDSIGSGGIISAGDVQVMSAGSGVVHSEFNHSKTNDVKLFQIWINTKENYITPSYSQRHFDIKDNKLITVVSGIKNSNELYIHQDAKISLGKFDSNKELIYEIDNSHGIFVFVIEGRLDIEGERLDRRDAIAIFETERIKIDSIKDAHFIIIEVPL